MPDREPESSARTKGRFDVGGSFPPVADRRFVAGQATWHLASRPGFADLPGAGLVPAPGSSHVSVTLESSERAPVEARAIVDRLEPELSPLERYDMRLGLSELVTNSVVHGNERGGDNVGLLISVSPGRIRCEVSDHGSGFVPVKKRRPGPGGLGLMIVDRLAARWGVNRDEPCVWFEIDRAPRRPRRPSWALTANSTRATTPSRTRIRRGLTGTVTPGS